jgi:hypothetical protein
MEKPYQGRAIVENTPASVKIIIPVKRNFATLFFYRLFVVKPECRDCGYLFWNERNYNPAHYIIAIRYYVNAIRFCF